MKGKIVLLGTSSAMPTKDRNNSGIYLQYKGEGFLFDCGEGTQRQIMRAGLSVYKTDYIFISHLHTDHTLGLPGLIETLDMHDKPAVEIHSVKGIKSILDCVLNGVIYAPDIEIKINEYIPEKEPFTTIDDRDFVVRAVGLNHVVDCIGFSFEEKPKVKYIKEKIKELNLSSTDFVRLKSEGFVYKDGKKIKKEDISVVQGGFKFTYIPDTYRTESIIKLARGSDILVIESTYLNEEDKAKEYGHLTLEYILEIYPKLECKKIVLTHFSRRYKDTSLFEKRIRAEGINNIVTGRDFMEFVF
ncbi:ribonuclease Z [Persephonella hydrogeniphila]|uniref:Ribonuclease Z n=1 Tax=Persephonella hydrogeniphila TaxID=198703 RepID=A0A285NFA4_9AQUI|nr:ribonuclease Z [Persephonella hydrogeniphila]SNZ08194.1 ribonuclease Z [Persephonella hydrogeniphila]